MKFRIGNSQHPMSDPKRNCYFVCSFSHRFARDMNKLAGYATIDIVCHKQPTYVQLLLAILLKMRKLYEIDFLVKQYSI